RRADLIARLGVLLKTYRAAGGERPVLLVHDERHGSALIAAMARAGRGLPPNVLPLALFSVLQLGHEMLAAALAFGAEHVVMLPPAEHASEVDAAAGQLALLTAVLDGLGYAGPRLHLWADRDPEPLEALLYGLTPQAALAPEIFAPLGAKRD